MTPENCLWQQRFKKLVSMMEDMTISISNEGLDVSTSRAWDCPEIVYVSFCGDVISSSEAKAIELWGEGFYDTYKLVKKGVDP